MQSSAPADPPLPIQAGAAAHTLASLWLGAGLSADALADAGLTGAEPVLPSSFAVTTAAQSAMAAAALAAAQIGRHRGGPRQHVAVDATHATLESCGWFRLDGKALDLWDELSGVYPCGGAAGEPGWVRIHANFAHHRDIALRVLHLMPGRHTGREAVRDALSHWRAEDFETAVADAGGVAAAARTFAQWDAHAQGRALAERPVLAIEPIDGHGGAAPRPWRAGSGDAPLRGLRVLDLTRILAGPVAGRTLAAYGAEVMLVNSPHLPNIANIADTSRGKLSVHVDLATADGRDTLRTLVREADVFLQGYRPGALARWGFGDAELASMKPGIVTVSLSAYGETGPWAGRRGFDSLVQTATGFNLAEAHAFGVHPPRAMPFQVLDYCAGYLLAFGAQVGLLHQRERGGAWRAAVSLAGVAQWLRGLGRVDGTRAPFQESDAPFERYAEESDSGFGRLRALRHAAQFSHTPARWERPSMRPGSHPAAWPER